MTLSSTLPASLDRSPAAAPPRSANSTAFHPHRLLELHLQRQWQQRRRTPVPLQVRCSYQNDRLILLIEHASGVRPDPRFTLSQFAAALQHLDGKLHGALFKVHKAPQKLTVGLYLRVLGEDRPYAAGGCTIAPPKSAPQPKPSPSPTPSQAPQTRKPIAAPVTTPIPERETEKSWGNSGVWLGGALLCLTTFAGSFWFMMQPCYVKTCTPLHQAEELKTSALGSIATAENWEQLKTIASQLEESQRLSRQVPLWSSYRPRATALYAETQGDLEAFAPITQAFEKAVDAVNQSKTPPYPIAQWQQTRSLWVQVLDTLRSIPRDNITYDLAQRKIQQYQGYLKLVDEAIVKENLGQSVLQQAEQSAKLAQLQKLNWEKSIRESPNVDRTILWQQIQTHWQTALETLGQIPEGTTAYRSIADYRQRYQKELSQFQDQNRALATVSDRFQQAQQKAKEAQDAEGEGRWDIARNSWEVALVSLQQIPEDSPQYITAQVLLPRYSQAYARAQQQSQKFAQVEQTRQDLAKICTTTPVICYFTVTPELIAVQVTTDYESKILTAGLWGDQQQALKHLQGLENALKTISDKAQIPLELYEPDGSLNSRYIPHS